MARRRPSRDPLGRPVRARWLPIADDGAAPSSRWPRRPGCRGWPRPSATRVAPPRRGTGELHPGRPRRGRPRSIALGIGGSATTDGGAGLLRALGADGRSRRLAMRRPRRPRPAPRRASTWRSPATSRTRSSARPAPPRPTGRRRAPRRPTSRSSTAASPTSPTRWSRQRAGGSATRRVPARPAASGSGCSAIAGPVPIASRCGPGVDLVMEATGFDAKLAAADLVITGEGRIDAQTAFGKTALGVARRARRGRRAVHRRRWRRGARGDRRARRRSGRSPCRSVERPQIDRGCDGRRHGPGRALRRAARPTHLDRSLTRPIPPPAPHSGYELRGRTNRWSWDREMQGASQGCPAHRPAPPKE